MIKNMPMMTRSKPVCNVVEDGENREVCSFTYKQVVDIVFIVVVVVVVNIYIDIDIAIIWVIVINLITIIFMINFTYT